MRQWASRSFRARSTPASATGRTRYRTASGAASGSLQHRRRIRRRRTSSCTRTRRTRSSTAPRTPRSWPPARPSWATRALALTDHDGLYGSLEFAHAAKAFGVRPITGAEVTLAGGAHVTLLVESARGYSNLCRLLTEAHRHTRLPGRESELLPPALDQSLLEELNEGLVCLSGCARHGLAVHDPNAAARLAAAFGRDRFYVELQRPYERGDARRNARLRELAETLGVATVVTGDAHAHHSSRTALQDALVAIKNRTSLEGSERERRGNRESVLLDPAEVADRFPDDRDAVARTVELAERLEFDLTQELGYRYPDFSDGRDSADVQLARICNRAFEERYGGANGHKQQRQSPARRGAGPDRGAEALRLLPAPLGGARAGARGRAGGARPRLAQALAAARARAGQLGRLARLLPDRPLARRPGRRRPLARPLHQPRARLRARHRPRLPARHPREADRRRHRALRPRARGARGQLRHLPLARRDPRPRQGARAPVRRAGAAGARVRRLEREARGRGARAAARSSAKARLAALASVRRALQRDRGPASTRLAAPGRDGDLLAPAGRARAGDAVCHGRPADVPVGQGLLCRRRLPEDRPARPGDAVGGRGLRRSDRDAARRDNRPLAHRPRRPRRLRGDPEGGHDRRLPDREPRADAGDPAHPSRDARGHHDPGRARAAGADPGRRRSTPTSSAARSCARTRRTSRRPTTRCSRNRSARPSASSSSRTRCSTWRWRWRGSRWGKPKACAGR